MMTLKVKDREYRVKFGYNSFCDTDLMDRTGDLIKIFSSETERGDKDVTGMGRLKDLFCCVRDLLFVGFQKFNPVETVQEIGEILDDYQDESTEENKRGIFDLFAKLTEELMNEGFLGDAMNAGGEEIPKKIPQDYKKPQK